MIAYASYYNPWAYKSTDTNNTMEQSVHWKVYIYLDMDENPIAPDILMRASNS
jgi:hypothetical protein